MRFEGPHKEVSKLIKSGEINEVPHLRMLNKKIDIDKIDGRLI